MLWLEAQSEANGGLSRTRVSCHQAPGVPNGFGSVLYLTNTLMRRYFSRRGTVIEGILISTDSWAFAPHQDTSVCGQSSSSRTK